LPSGLKGTQRRQDLFLGLAPPQRVLALQRRDGLDRVCAPDRLHTGLREAEVLDLARVDQLLDRSGNVLDRDVRVDAVLVEQVDPVRSEPLERRVDAALDRRRAAVEPAPVLFFEVEAELRRDHDLVAHRLERLAHELLVRERPVHLCGVEERDATLDCRPSEADHLLPVGDREVALAHPHAAEPDRRHFQTVSERALLHRPSCIRRVHCAH
jgi:hypothetical protein